MMEYKIRRQTSCSMPRRFLSCTFPGSTRSKYITEYEWHGTGPWARLLDTGRTLELPVVLDNSSQARRAGGGIRAAAQRIRAERTGATQSTLGTLGSLTPTASLTDKLTSSQYALGECRSQFNAQLDSKGRSCGRTCSRSAFRCVTMPTLLHVVCVQMRRSQGPRLLRQMEVPAQLQRLRNSRQENSMFPLSASYEARHPQAARQEVCTAQDWLA
jgi:hypothetical protein